MKSPFTYKIQLPENMESGKKYPVIYTLHGMGSNEQNMFTLTDGMNKDFIIVGIRGNLPQGHGFSYFYIKSFGNPERDLFDRSVNQLKEFFQYATNSYPIDSSRQYLLGFSQGAILAMTLALVLGDEIKGIAALNGYIPEFVAEEYLIQPSILTSVFISHGEFDTIFPVSIGYKNHDFFLTRTDKVLFKTYPVGHEVSVENIHDLQEWIYQDLTID